MKEPENMLEAYFRKKIIDPWLNIHADYWFPTTGVRCRNGILDYCCVINGLPVYIEAKAVDGIVSQYQKIEIKKLQAKDILVIVTDPLNWDKLSKHVLNITKGKRRPKR